jgi:TRAP-type C4-dicarboxylate transport system substrate-binding protein
MGTAVATAVGTVLAGALPRQARAATTLRWATVLPTNHPAVAMMERVAKQVREQTGGASRSRRSRRASSARRAT